MASKFPAAESKILSLGREMAAGFAANINVYPDPPVNAEALEGLITTYTNARDALVSVHAHLQQAREAKEEAMQALLGGMKSDLRYAENIVHYDDGKLQLIGWSGRRPASTLHAPGQVRDLISPNRGDGWITLEWKAPVDGGKVVAYRVQRREPGEDAWKRIDTSLETEITVEDQRRGKKFEFCVVAMNKTGDGPISNEITAVL
uniref:Fibronectin type III domain-containing protein n=1 Tax=Candidatus Kentrum sp. MB TaxID=2138164 RepID=A0A450XX57_9GAMM|nr:MAG: Fibronectin type III domain-containing protein [Candidatus Kentron sp. MB]VFK36130.1 MAG: Fibronectin type III domain-containing protein [Candidatus Kentron sp. MB]VFK77657.1 MAG: Fibronectin type III domain-containing protein [Candidatus Kentron sp. MB]